MEVTALHVVLYWFLPLVAVNYVVVEGVIFQGVRDRIEARGGKLVDLIECPICCSFYSGLFVGAVNVVWKYLLTLIAAYLPALQEPLCDVLQTPVLLGIDGIAIYVLLTLFTSTEKKDEGE
jgi:hypothetical protein